MSNGNVLRDSVARCVFKQAASMLFGTFEISLT